MQSSACLSGHAIQHREKPFIQQSLPTPASKLPSNSVRAEWTRWQGSAALSPPLLCSHPDHVCFLQLPPLSHSAYPTPPKNISASSFLSVFSFLLIPFYVLPVVSFSFLRVILLHNDLLLSAFSFPESRCFNNTVKFISSSTQLKTFSTLPLSLCFPLINQPLL